METEKLEQLLKWAKRKGLAIWVSTSSCHHEIRYSDETGFWYGAQKMDKDGYVSGNDYLNEINEKDAAVFLDVLRKTARLPAKEWNNWKRAKLAHYGGKRKGAGNKYKWKEPTKVMRVPVSMIDKVREFIDSEMSKRTEG